MRGLFCEEFELKRTCGYIIFDEEKYPLMPQMAKVFFGYARVGPKYIYYVEINMIILYEEKSLRGDD